MLYQTQLESLLESIVNKRNSLADELRSLPEGDLHIMQQDGSIFYNERFPKKGNRKKERRRGITKDKDAVFALVRKKYVEKALIAMDADIAVLEKALKNYVPCDESSVMRDFVYKHPELASGIYRDASGLDEWAANYERKKDFYEESLASVSSSRDLMRSRGEIIIGEKLKEYGIPYRFEAKLDIPDLPYVPDFTIKRPRDGMIFYWEHIGDVNDEDYMAGNEHKFERYEEYGIVPWKNLIVTYDFENGGVNVPLIEAMIHAWLL